VNVESVVRAGTDRTFAEFAALNLTATPTTAP
jgi:hypothetical protein